MVLGDNLFAPGTVSDDVTTIVVTCSAFISASHTATSTVDWLIISGDVTCSPVAFCLLSLEFTSDERLPEFVTEE